MVGNGASGGSGWVVEGRRRPWEDVVGLGKKRGLIFLLKNIKSYFLFKYMLL
jgi:hypothetical protein